MPQVPIVGPIKGLRQWWQRYQVLNNPLPDGPRLHQPEPCLPPFVRQCSIAMHYHRLLHEIDWPKFPASTPTETQFQAVIPRKSFAAACVVKLDQRLPYMSHLRQYLVDHPALVWLLGFPLVASRQVPWGFDADASLPTARHLTRLLRQMPNDSFQFLLDESVRLLRDELAEEAFGDVISLDTKHILAWVKENNPKAYVSERYNKDKQPVGDPDCKLGCKKRHNQQGNVEHGTPTMNPVAATDVEVGEFHWGYASGVVATQVAGYGEFVLAELTQTFDRPDVSYFFPLMQQVERRLGARPCYGAFDAAFDAFYVYEYFHREPSEWQAAFAAVPYSKRNGPRKTFSPEGHPLCEAQLVMQLAFTYTCRTTLYEHQREHYICPLKNSDQSCPIQHKRWQKEGCTTRLPSSVGARLRHQIDRDSLLYETIYKQRTATERINALATELGIERPRLRNRQAITNQNTLIYVLLNLRGLRRVRQRKGRLD